MKVVNIFIIKYGVLKLVDFGFVRVFSTVGKDKQNRYTNRVVILWYRLLELFLGERNYGFFIDLWGVGCIMVEMWIRIFIMQGKIEQYQFQLISQLCGFIIKEVWFNVEKFDMFGQMELVQGQKRKVKDRFKVYVKDQYVFDLIDKLLIFDLLKRIDSDIVFNYDFFWLDFMFCELVYMLFQHFMFMFEFLVFFRRFG